MKAQRKLDAMNGMIEYLDATFKDSVATVSDLDTLEASDAWRWACKRILELAQDEAWDLATCGVEYCCLEAVIRDWDKRAICVEFSDGSDALLQENGYTLEDCIQFVKEGCQFFYDD